MSTEGEKRGLDGVCIPSQLHARIGRFFSDLQRETLRAACLRAAARIRDGEVCELTQDDVIVVAARSLAQASASLEHVFAPQEFDHVRRAS